MYRKIAAIELARFIGAIAHPERIRIIEELKYDELDVSTIQDRLQLVQSGVSRHLGILKAQGIVTEKRIGRRVLYRLSIPRLSAWLIDGLEIICENTERNKSLKKTFVSAKKLWRRRIKGRN